MAGIRYYPSRTQDKNQRVIQTNANIALTASNMGSFYYCYGSSAVYISLSEAEESKIPIGSQVDFARLSGSSADVIFSSPIYPIYYFSPVGQTPKIRVQNAVCSFIKVAAQEWIIVGDITAS